MPSTTWDQIRSRAEQLLRTRGIDPDSVSIDDLLDEQDVRRIEARFSGGFTIEARLDRYDLAAVLAAANAGKIMIYGGNPLAFNYAQWLRFIHALYRWIGTKLTSPSDVLMGQANANRLALENGWPPLGPVGQDLPSLRTNDPST